MNVKRFTPLRIFVFILFSLYALTLFIALGWVILQTFKTADEFSKIGGTLALPDSMYFGNYAEAFENLYDPATRTTMLGMIINSLWYTFGSIFVQMASAVVVAYVVAKFKFFGRELLYTIALVTLMIPIVGAGPSAYRIYGQLGILDNPFIVLKNLNAFGWNFLVIFGFFKGLSWSYAESAYIDGANHFTVFFRIMLPQVITPVLALCIMGFINLWNDYMTPLLYFPSYPTLITGLYLYEDQMGRLLNYPVLFAGIIICITPIVVVFIAFQKQILEINIGGGLKG